MHLCRGGGAQLPGDVRSQHGSQTLADGWVLRGRSLDAVALWDSVGAIRAVWRLAVAPQAAESHQAELGQIVGHFLLIGVLAGLHATLLQRVVVVEEVDEQVPQHASVVQVGLQEEVHCKGADALHPECGRFGKTLGINFSMNMLCLEKQKRQIASPSRYTINLINMTGEFHTFP